MVLFYRNALGKTWTLDILWNFPGHRSLIKANVLNVNLEEIYFSPQSLTSIPVSWFLTENTCYWPTLVRKKQFGWCSASFSFTATQHLSNDPNRTIQFLLETSDNICFCNFAIDCFYGPAFDKVNKFTDW